MNKKWTNLARFIKRKEDSNIKSEIRDIKTYGNVINKLLYVSFMVTTKKNTCSR